MNRFGLQELGYNLGAHHARNIFVDLMHKEFDPIYLNKYVHIKRTPASERALVIATDYDDEDICKSVWNIRKSDGSVKPIKFKDITGSVCDPGRVSFGKRRKYTKEIRYCYKFI